MRLDTTIAVVVREDLPAWQKLNVTAFTASGVAAGTEGAVGEPYEDADGVRYLPMFRQPVPRSSSRPVTTRPTARR